MTLVRFRRLLALLALAAPALLAHRPAPAPAAETVFRHYV